MTLGRPTGIHWSKGTMDAQAVVDALKVEGIEASGAFDPEIDQRSNTIHVMVDTKP